ncbi:solute carrier 7, member 6 opposite strand [Lunasporangiospora selenospora]|uniref:Solute carrier 7, member 6 opposite strand n=1 Tax=Lunasporangiospora selenospora TaxID=979761 RepID=A0A9P6KEC5_9FUNG|nr:solute carrier 7, member 6 opposite strand [Lunasporangiospora selenospora]
MDSCSSSSSFASSSTADNAAASGATMGKSDNPNPIGQPAPVSRKPTAASIGTRSLLKPLKGCTTEGLGNLKESEQHRNRNPGRGIPIGLPTFAENAPTATTTTPAATALDPFTAPFSFDNHTAPERSDPAKTGGAKEQTNGGVTILRIKRRRNEEPLDALVLQAQAEKLSGKRQRVTSEGSSTTEASKDTDQQSTVTVFRLATTVNETSFKDPAQSTQLRDRITRLTESSSSQQRNRLSKRYTAEFGERVLERREELAHAKRAETRMARYRVINRNRFGSDPSEKAPPVVKSSLEAQAEAALDVFSVFDAVKEEEPKSKEQLMRESEESDIVCNLLPMVREYLAVSEKTTGPKSSTESPTTRSSLRMSGLDNTKKADDNDDDDEDYVYDIYYKDNNAESYRESEHRAIGSLSDDDFDDSDSNAEDYYQNDYPDEEFSDGYDPYALSDSDNDEYMY